MTNIYDIIVIGGGPAGSAATVYAARKKIKTLLITERFGGQSVVSDKIENWIGVVEISGVELAKILENHVRAQEGIEVKTPEKVKIVKGKNNCFEIITDKNNVYQTKTVLVASGGRRRRLKVPGEDKFEGRGVSFCSTCDAPFFRDKVVAVVGGGNAGLEAVIDLVPYAKEIYLLNRGQKPTGDPTTQEDVKKESKAAVINNAEVQEILGDKIVTGIKYLNSENNETKELSVQGVFVEIGSVPNSEMVKDLVKTDKYGEIVVDHQTGATSVSGIFAAGDVTDEIYKQNNIAAGNAIAATLSAYNYLLNIKKKSPACE